LVDDVIFGLDGMGWDGMGWFHGGSSPEACRWMTSSLFLWGKNPKCTLLVELHRGQCFLAGKLRTKTC
jgi:hypothetical protein